MQPAGTSHSRPARASAARANAPRANASSGLAALEFALLAPLLVTLLFVLIDLGRAFSQHFQIVTAVSNGASYAFNAWQTGSAAATVTSNTASVVAATSNALLTTGKVSVAINNGASSSYKCCLTTGSGGAVSWSCSNPAPTCSDGSNPGTYISVQGSASFQPLFPFDTLLNGKTLSSSVLQRIQ